MNLNTRKQWNKEWVVPDVMKALDANSQFANAIDRQDLEDQLTRLNLLDTPFLDRLDRQQATALQHEYTVVSSRHDKLGYAAYMDGGFPRKIDAEASTRKVRPSLIGHRASITELGIMVTQAGIAQAEELLTTEKMTAVAEETENALFNGEKQFGSPNAESSKNLQMDGVIAMTKNGAPMNVIDAKGQPLSLALLWAAQTRAVQTQAAAKPNDIYMSYPDKIALQSQFYNLARTDKTERVQGVLGANATTMISPFGESTLTPSRFLGNTNLYLADGFGSTSGEYSRPGVPTVTVQPTAQALTVNPAAPQVTGLDAATNVIYAFKAFNFFGESSAVLGNAVTTVTAGQQVTASLNVDPNTAGVIVYRDSNDGRGMQFLGKYKYNGSGTFVFVDNGFETVSGSYGTFVWKKMPGTSHVVGVDHNTTALAQWLPMEKLFLPAGLATDFVVRHAVSVFARAPEFNFLIVNVGQEVLA